MQGLIKLAAWMAPIFLLALVIILSRLDKQSAEYDTDAARFDREFSYQQADFSDKKAFWQEEAKDAANRLEMAKTKQAKAEGNVSQHTDILEQTLKEMDREEREK
jgi:hypothetical protein